MSKSQRVCSCSYSFFGVINSGFMDKAVKVLLVPIKFKFYMFCRSDTPVDDIACGLHDRGSSPE